MSALIKKIAQKIMVDYHRLSIVSNPDRLLTQDSVRSLLHQLYNIVLIPGSPLDLRIHYELEYKAHEDIRYIYITENIDAVLPDIRNDAYICDINTSDLFPLFADKALLNGLAFEVLDELYNQVAKRRVSMAESKHLVDEIIKEQEKKAKQTSEYCIKQLSSIMLDWAQPTKAMEAISDVVVNAVRNGVFSKITPALDEINQSFQKWIDSSYFATLQSNHLMHPKSVNKILPHLADKYERDDKVALLVVDGFTYWQYSILKEFLYKNGLKTDDNTTLSWLPSITMLSRQAIFRGGVPVAEYKQSPDNEKKLWQAFWQQKGYSGYEIQYISDKDEFAINEGVKRLAIVTVEMDEKMHSSTDNRDLMSLTENWCPRIADIINTVLSTGFKLYLTTDHGSTLSTGWRALTPVESVFLFKDGSRGKRHLIYNNQAELERFYNESPLSILKHDNWLTIRDARCFAKEGETMITHGGSHFTEVVIPFINIFKQS